MCLNSDLWCFCVKKRWWFEKHEKHVFFGFFRGLSKSCILSWWLSKLSRWTTLSRTNTRFVSARARARVRARAETHRVFVLDLTTHRLNGQNKDLAKLRGPHSGAESTPKWVIFGSPLWIRGWYINAPDDLRGVVKRVPKMGQKWVFWATFRSKNGSKNGSYSGSTVGVKNGRFPMLIFEHKRGPKSGVQNGVQNDVKMGQKWPILGRF